MKKKIKWKKNRNRNTKIENRKNRKKNRLIERKNRNSGEDCYRIVCLIAISLNQHCMN